MTYQNGKYHTKTSMSNAMKKKLGICVHSCKPVYFVYVLLLCLGLVAFRYVFDVAMSVFPEVDMLMNSKCNNVLNMWDGRIWLGVDIPIWYNAAKNLPPEYNINEVASLEADEHPLVPHFSQRLQNDRPIVIWGSHHKTGTYLAKKLFSKICAKMNWCCYFTRTRDSITNIDAILAKESVDVLSHNQWIWSPKADNITNYRFFHFYRQPIKKILSGYRYHYDGMEKWVTKPLFYNETCAAKFVKSSGSEVVETDRRKSKRKDSRRDKMASVNKMIEQSSNPTSRQALEVLPTSSAGHHQLSSLEVMEYCKSVHLCETCCRKAHLTSETAHSARQHPEFSTTYRLRPNIEYQFMCKYLGGTLKGRSLMAGLHSLSPQDGLLAEAALDYYESLRMAHIYADTLNDPYSLNMDLDFMIKHFDTALGMILDHLKDLIPSHSMRTFLHEDLKFYDLKESPIYRWSMDNPLIGHVNSKESSTGNNSVSLNDLLLESEDFQRLYKPVFDLMDTKREKRGT